MDKHSQKIETKRNNINDSKCLLSAYYGLIS